MTILGLGVGAWMLLLFAVGLGALIEGVFLWRVLRRSPEAEEDAS